MTMDRHEPFEELISASLTGDLTVAERQRLDAHLDTCPTCRATLAAFAEQRRIMSGLRHVGPPRDLGARVRYGIEGGAFATVPWWRRPAVLFAGVGGSLAAVAGALLALVLLNGLPQNDPVGQSSASPSASPAATQIAGATPTPAPATPVPTAAPTPPAPTLPPPPDPNAPAPTEAPSTEPGASPTPIPASPEPDVFLAFTGPVESPELTVVDGSTGEEAADVAEAPGPPVAAELSPDSGYLAVTTRLGESGLNEIQVTRLAADASGGASPSPSPSSSAAPMEPGATLTLAESVAVDPFVERMTWSPDGGFLAFTVADPASLGETDVWVFEAATHEAWQLTEAGNAYAGSWVRGEEEDDPPLLWVSSAAEEPISHLVAVVDADDERRELIDPSEDALAEADGVFLPILNPSGRFAIYWSGRMAEEPDRGWFLAEGGAPNLSEHKLRNETWTFDNERPLFSDLTIDRDAFTSAAISWGSDDVTFAVSEVQWTGTSQGDEGAQYPDPGRVYFGHATDPQGLTQFHAIDIGDIPEGSSVIDVKVSPTGRHLVITALRPTGGDLDEPMADLLLVTRNLGRTPDEVEVIGNGDEGWFGPAAFDELLETEEEN